MEAFWRSGLIYRYTYYEKTRVEPYEVWRHHMVPPGVVTVPADASRLQRELFCFGLQAVALGGLGLGQVLAETLG